MLKDGANPFAQTLKEQRLIIEAIASGKKIGGEKGGIRASTRKPFHS